MVPADNRGARPGRLTAWCLVLGLLSAGSALAAGPAEGGLPPDAEKRLSAVLDGTASAFVLHDPSRDRFVRYDRERCRRRLTPFSTFKIPNTLIALDTGVIRDPDATVRRDPEKHPRQDFWPEPWMGDQTLHTAFRNSVVWFYQDLAVAVGPAKMKRYLDRFHYGNRDLSGGQDRFWLGSSLKISADEQVEFLQAFHGGHLGLKPETTRIAKEVFQYEKGDGYVLSAKTGGGETGSEQALGLLPPEAGPASRASGGAVRAPGAGTGGK